MKKKKKKVLFKNSMGNLTHPMPVLDQEEREPELKLVFFLLLSLLPYFSNIE